MRCCVCASIMLACVRASYSRGSVRRLWPASAAPPCRLLTIEMLEGQAAARICDSPGSQWSSERAHSSGFTSRYVNQARVPIARHSMTSLADTDDGSDHQWMTICHCPLRAWPDRNGHPYSWDRFAWRWKASKQLLSHSLRLGVHSVFAPIAGEGASGECGCPHPRPSLGPSCRLGFCRRQRPRQIFIRAHTPDIPNFVALVRPLQAVRPAHPRRMGEFESHRDRDTINV